VHFVEDLPRGPTGSGESAPWYLAAALMLITASSRRARGVTKWDFG
jgi:hypothetical protein